MDYISKHKNDSKFGKYVGIILVFLLVGCSHEYRIQTRVNGYNDTIFVVQYNRNGLYYWDDVGDYKEDSLNGYYKGFHNKADADSLIKALVAGKEKAKLQKYHAIEEVL